MAAAPLDLASLVARLRNAGLKTDIRQYLAAHELLLAMARQGRDLQHDNEALASHLGPIFCGSAEDQQLFRQELLAWRGEKKAAPPPETRVPVEEKVLRKWLVVAGLAAALALTAVVLWRQLRPDPLPPPVAPAPVESAAVPDRPPPPVSTFVVSPSARVASDDVPVGTARATAARWNFVLAGMVGGALLTFFGLWLRHKLRRDQVLSRLAPDPDTRRIELNPPPPTVTRIRPGALRRICAGLRRTRPNEVFELSVGATVDATAKAGGFVVPVFAPRVAIPEYLVLIDRRGESDHGAQLVHGWMQQLGEQGVQVDCYEFDADPRVCRPFGTQRSARLQALLARHHRATVFLCAESSLCIDPLTHRPQSWLRAFNNLPNRVLLTLSPPYRWAAHEQQLLDAGFVVVPASPGGLQIAAAMDRKSLEAIGAGAKYAREFPRLISQDALRWLDRNPPPAETVARLLRALHDYLGPDGYAWLCACAVYPQISWPITLKLLDALLPAENELAARRAIEEQLPALARLPWFRYGYLPDWLRRLLIAHLGPDKETRVRATLEQLVCGLLGSAPSDGPANADTPRLGIRIRPKAIDVARAAPPDSPLRDEVFLGFLAGAAPDPLALRLTSLSKGGPRARDLATSLRERWRALGERQPVLRRALISLLAAVPVGIILWLDLRAPGPGTVADSDLTFYLESSELGSSGVAVAVAPNGKFILLASWRAGRVVEMWDLPGTRLLARFQTRAQPYKLAISPRSDRIAVWVGDGSLYVSSMGEAGLTSPLVETPLQTGPADQPTILKFSQDSRRLLHGSALGLEVYDLDSNQNLALVRDVVHAATFDPDNPDRVLFIGADLKLRAFDTRTTRFDPMETSLSNLADFSLDGQYVALLTGDNPPYRVEFRDTRTLSILAQAPTQVADDELPNGFAWSGDGNLVAFDRGPGTNVIFDIASGHELLALQSQLTNPNRLYTIRFVRSAARRPDYTYYEISERTIKAEPIDELAQFLDEPAQMTDEPPPESQTTPDDSNASAPPRDPTPRVPSSGEIAKRNEQVLSALDRETAERARRLIDLARREGVTISLSPPRGATRHRSEDARQLDAIGRAFNVAVLMPTGAWSSNDFSSLATVGKLGVGLGLDWSGDWGYRDYAHFDLPLAGDSAAQVPAQSSNAPPEATPPETAAPASDPVLRLARTEYEFPRDRDVDRDVSAALSNVRGATYAGVVRTTEGSILGAFSVQLEVATSGDQEVSQIRLVARAVGNPEDVFPPGRIPDNVSLVEADNTLTVREFVDDKVTSRSVDPGVLRITMTVEDARILDSYGTPRFADESLRIRVTVQAQPGEYQRSRTPAQSN